MQSAPRTGLWLTCILFTSFPLPTLHFPNSLPGLSLLNEARACASHSQELHPGNLTDETFYLSLSTQDPTGKFEFNKPLSQFTGFAPLPPPRNAIASYHPICLLSSNPAAPARLLPLPCPFSPLRRKPGHLPVHLPPRSTLQPLDLGPGQYPLSLVFLQQPRAPNKWKKTPILTRHWPLTNHWLLMRLLNSSKSQTSLL